MGAGDRLASGGIRAVFGPTAAKITAEQWAIATDTDLPVRFWSKVQKNEIGCWLWTAHTVGNGYGQIWSGGEFFLAHRIAYLLAIGPIESGKLICHRCDNPRCVRPEHLFQGTVRDNANDSLSKGRHPQATKKFCRNGHLYSLENTILIKRKSIRGNGQERRCALCQQAANTKATKKNSNPRCQSLLAEPDKPPTSVKSHGSVPPPNNHASRGRRRRRAKATGNGG